MRLYKCNLKLFKVIKKQHLHCTVLTSVLGINTLSTVEAAPVFFPSSHSELLLISKKCITHTFHVVVFLWAALFTLNSWWHWIYLCDWTEPNLLSWMIYRGNSWELELKSKREEIWTVSSWAIRRLSAIRWECYSRPRGNSRSAVCQLSQ